MNNKEDARKFILKKLEECCLFVHDKYPKSIFHIWDKQLIRTKKLIRLSGKNDLIYFKPGKNSLYLFEQDYNNGNFSYSYKNIYKILESKYSFNNIEINDIIKCILHNDIKTRALTPSTNFIYDFASLINYNKDMKLLIQD